MADNLSQFANISNNSDTRLVLSLWYGAWSCFGLILVVTVLLATVIQKLSKLSPFYTLLVNLNIANLLMFLIYLIYVVPCVAIGIQLYGQMCGRFFAYCQSIAFSTILQNSFLISVNRSLTVCNKSLHDKIFRRKLSKGVTAFTWIFSVTVSSIDNVLGCSPTFLEDKFVFSNNCSKIPSYLTTKSLLLYICVYFVALFYIMAILKLWKTKKTLSEMNEQVATHMSSYQMSMFYQAICIWVALLANAIGEK